MVMSKKILITGSNGLVGMALQSTQKFHYECVFADRATFGDLRIKQCVEDMFNDVKPHYVIHTAAKVGGIGGNTDNHGSFFYDNLLINTNVIDACKTHNIEKMLAFSSVCVFPDNLALLQEDHMHDGPVFQDNFAYGYAKRMVDIQIQAYKAQYGITNYCSIIPGNIFGKHDMYCLKYGHVIPMLIHKLYLARKNKTSFNIWGDGKSLREFLYVEDVATILWKLLNISDIPDKLIVSGPQQYSIREVVDLLVKISDFQGAIVWETDKPNGQRSRQTDLSRLHSLFNMEYTSLEQGLNRSWHWFVQHYPNIRTEYND